MLGAGDVDDVVKRARRFVDTEREGTDDWRRAFARVALREADDNKVALLVVVRLGLEDRAPRRVYVRVGERRYLAVLFTNLLGDMRRTRE